MASIYKRGKTWTANVFVLKDGVRRRKTKSGFRTKAEASGWAGEQELAKANKTITLNSTVTFYDAFKQWYELFKEPHITKTTAKSYKYTLSRIDANFQSIQLIKVDRNVYQKFINEFGSEHARETVVKIRAHIHQFAQEMLLQNQISKDFTLGIKTVSKDGKKSNLKFLDEKDLINLIKTLRSRPVNERSVSDMMILFAIFTGTRFSEVTGLTWDNIDFKNNKVSIVRTWDQNFKEFKPTKNESSNRTIDIPDKLIEELKEYQKEKINDFVFSAPNGQPITNNGVNKQLDKLLHEIDADKIISFHGLRHTHASFLLSKDVDLKYVSERLGHLNYEITLNTYAHLLQGKRSIEIDKSIKLLNNM